MHSLLEKISNSGSLKPVLRFPFVSRGREGVENETYVLRFASFCELFATAPKGKKVRLI